MDLLPWSGWGTYRISAGAIKRERGGNVGKQLLMSVDLGTSFIKAGVYNTESQCIAEELEPVKDYRPSPGSFIQKGDELFQSVVNCIKKVVVTIGDDADLIAAIGFTGQMAGFIGVDKDWNDITTWSCSLDTRYMPYAERQMTFLKNDFLELAGTNSPQMASKFEWFAKDFPEESKKIAKYMMISSYIIGKLSDIPIEEATIDRSYLAWTGLSDINQNAWSDKICAAIDLDQKYLPKIVNASEVCGHLSEKTATKTGLKAGIPLVSGSGDKVAGALGAAIVTPGDMIFEAGSYGEISCCVEEYRPDMAEGRLDVLGSAIPNHFLSTHFIAGSGITIDWFVNTFVRKDGEKISEAFKRVEAEVEKVEPGSNNLGAIGLLGGSAMPLNGLLKGMFYNFDWCHGIGHFYRALLESFSFDFALSMRNIDKLYPEYNTEVVNVIGGGAKSEVWMQMMADVSGKTFYNLDRGDAAMWGTAIIAGHGVGIFDNMQETAQKFVTKTKKFVPNMELHAVYQPLVDRYAEALKVSEPVYNNMK